MMERNEIDSLLIKTKMLNIIYKYSKNKQEANVSSQDKLVFKVQAVEIVKFAQKLIVFSPRILLRKGQVSDNNIRS